MKRLILPISLLLLSALCGKEEDSDVFHFDNSNVYPLFNEPLARDPAWSPEMGSIVFSYLNDLWSISPDGGEPTQITTMGGQEQGVNWSPASGANKLVFFNTTGSESYKIYTLTPGGGEPAEIAEFTSQISSTSFSNDGETIVFLRFGKKGIFTVPAAGGDIGEITNSDGWETVEFAQACPSREFVIYVDRDGSTYRINEISLAGGSPKVLISFSGTAEHPTSVAESYDGSQVAYGTPFPVTYIQNLFFVPSTGGNRLQITAFRTPTVRDPTWASDGKKLAIQMSEGIYIVELKI
ncbi:TolB family protein [candidate division KSB1 bacterium]